MAYFGLLLDSVKGLEFIPPTPPYPRWPLCTHTQTHMHAQMSPPPLPPTFLYSQSGGSGPGIFKQFIFLSLTCVFIPPPPNSLGCFYFFLCFYYFFFGSFFFFFAIVKLEANILNGYGTGLGSGCEENPLFLHKTSVYWITWEARWALCVD